MSLQWFRSAVVTLIKLVLVFGRHNVGADFSDNCDNSPNSLSCIHTYEELYNSLAKSENSFNIESAIYPSRRPSSVRVFVNLHGPNETENLIVPYTWSLSCFYVAVPPLILDVLSLGSILVTPRTQTLNITIPYFCCNVSKKENERRMIIKERIKRALASLQDLAVSPGIRDPRMNTAECVIEGHGIDIEATGRSVYIRIIQWCSILFALAVYFILASFAEHCRIEGWPENTAERENTNTTGRDKQKIRIKNTAKAIYYLIILLSFLGHFQHMVIIVVLTVFFLKEGLFYVEILFILVPIWFTMVIYLLRGPISHLHDFLEKHFPCLKLPRALPVSIDRGEEDYPSMRTINSISVVLTFSAMASFCSYWMLIGIMLNPTWGLTVTLIICFIFASFTYAVYEYLTLISCTQDEVKPDKLHALLPGMLSFLAVLFLIPALLFASPWFNGRENAYETVTTILMTALATFIWLTSKKLLGKKKKSEEKVIDSRQTLTGVSISDARQPSSSELSTHSASSQNSYYSCHSESHPLVNDHGTAESQPSNDVSFISLSQKSQACGKMVQNSENIEFNETQRIYRESNV